MLAARLVPGVDGAVALASTLLIRLATLWYAVALGGAAALALTALGLWMRVKRSARYGNALLAIALAIVHLDAWAAADERYHAHFIELAGNRQLQATVLNYWDRAHRARMFTLRLRPKPVNSTKEHRQMVDRLRAAVLISGRGSNLLALVAAARDPAYPARIVAVVSDIARQGAREAEQRKATLVAGLDMTLTLLAALPPSKYDGPLTKRVIKLADLTADTQPAWLKTPERQQLAQGEAVCRPTRQRGGSGLKSTTGGSRGGSSSIDRAGGVLHRRVNKRPHKMG